MSLAELCRATSDPAEHIRSLWRMMAFAARYGHTDPSVSRRMPVTELMAFVEELAKLIEEEKESMKGPGDS